MLYTLVMFVFMFLLLAVLLECVRPGIQSTAELQQQSAQQANTDTHTDTKTCLTTCLLRWGVWGEGSCNLSLSYTHTHVLSVLRSSAKFKVCSKTILQICMAQVNPVLDDSP